MRYCHIELAGSTEVDHEKQHFAQKKYLHKQNKELLKLIYHKRQRFDREKLIVFDCYPYIVLALRLFHDELFVQFVQVFLVILHSPPLQAHTM